MRRERASYRQYRCREQASYLEAQAARLDADERRARRAERIARYLPFQRRAADAHREVAEASRRQAQQVRARAQAVLDAPEAIGDVVVDRTHHWARLNTDLEPLARHGVWSDDVSLLTGNDRPPPSDRSRPYGVRHGLRPPLALHQTDLERAVPRDDAGRPVRGADPRLPYFRLVNDGGPAMDPTRGINCQDCVLSFYETYVHGRPRVSAPRTFDAYASGDVGRPEGGEAAGVERTELITGGRFQALCGDVSDLRPADAQRTIDGAFTEVERQLRAAGPGSFAFLINGREDGAAHAWCAVNQGGEILFVDPQLGRVAGRSVAGTVPTLYRHRGRPSPDNVVRLDALVVSGRGKVVPFDGLPDGFWHVRNKTLPSLAVVERPERPRTREISPSDWHRLNTDVGDLAPGPVETDDRSRLTDTDGPPSVHRSRRYHVRGGLRPPLALHQTDLERAMPRHRDGTVIRQADPRVGTWFGLANDGGPAADPTRGINCVDGVLSLFDTYVHGRPRVSAPRTFDAYAHGDPDRPLGAEADGLARIESTAGGRFQGLCPNVADDPPATAQQTVDRAWSTLETHLRALGHGSFAFLVTDTEGGAAHAWTALNQNGTILFLDPQTGAIAEGVPLYRHRGTPAESNVTSVDALVVTPHGEYAPLPADEVGPWSRRNLEPTGGEPDIPESDRHDPPGVGYFTRLYAENDPAEMERRILESMSPGRRAILARAVADAEAVADRAQRDLEAVLADGGPQLVDTEHRVKTARSLARAFGLRKSLKRMKLSDFLADQKDRVRFSLVTDEVTYAHDVFSTLDALRAYGYRVAKVVNFWRGDGRHNGLNVSLLNADGFPVELQFPTARSRECGKKTHLYYETIRLASGMPTALQVDAYLRSVAENVNRLASHQPTDLDRGPVPPALDTTFGRWFVSDPDRPRVYSDWLRRHGLTLDEMISRHGLDPASELGSQRTDRNT